MSEDEQIKGFNKRFRDTDWYPNNWKPIEEWLRKALTVAEQRGIEKGIIMQANEWKERIADIEKIHKLNSVVIDADKVKFSK